MLRRSHILTTTALLAVCATPAFAAPYEDLRSPDAVDAAEHRGLYAERPSESPVPGLSAQAERAARGPDVLNRDYGSPDAADAAQDLPSTPSVTHAGPGPYTDSERGLVESPEVQAMVRRAISEVRATPAVITVHEPSGGFDWGDAGIGAAGALALFSIAGGSALMLSERRRRRAVGVATH
jgi:hypothetical protein